LVLWSWGESKHINLSETSVWIGDDTDTVAAIAGALLGARWGTGAIPDEWNTIIHGDRQRGSEPVTGTELGRLARKAAFPQQ
jgi:ADP-ribosyl-[dinitrogen reductase] hydrolase